jgi:hypothetical protein
MGRYLKEFDAHNSTSATSALNELAKWTTFPYFKEYVVEDPNAGFQQAEIAPARLGDPSPIRQLDGTCTPDSQ